MPRLQRSRSRATSFYFTFQWLKVLLPIVSMVAFYYFLLSLYYYYLSCPRGFFAKKKSQILRPKCKNFASWKGQILQKFCDVSTQPNFFLCNENTAGAHPQSLIFFLLNVDHLLTNITSLMEAGL